MKCSKKPLKFFKKSSRPFVLLEILIAFFLVALCIFPLVFSQVYILRSEKALNNTLKSHRTCNAFFCEVVEKLYKKEIKVSEQQPLIFDNGEVKFHFTKKKESDNASFYILKTTITDSSKMKSHYYLFAQGKGFIP